MGAILQPHQLGVLDLPSPHTGDARLHRMLFSGPGAAAARVDIPACQRDPCACTARRARKASLATGRFGMRNLDLQSDQLFGEESRAGGVHSAPQPAVGAQARRVRLVAA